MILYKCSDFIPGGQEFNAFSCAELRAKREHSHEFFELAYVRSGIGGHYSDGDMREVSPGNFVLVSPGASHCFLSPAAKDAPWLRVDNCLFTPALFAEVRDEYLSIPGISDTRLYSLIKNGEHFCLVLSDNAQGEIRSYTEALSRKRGMEKPGIHTLVKGLFCNVLIEAGWIYENRPPKSPPSSGEGSDIEHLIRYIKANLDIELTLSLLAAQIHMSPSYLSRYFKQKTGRNISEFIAGLRIEKARELLGATAYSVTDVCFMCGYSSTPNFRKYFRRLTGMSPAEYRKKAREKGTV